MLPDVAGFHRQLDYLVPDRMAPYVRPGTLVRVPLQGRRVRGWVTAWPVGPTPGLKLRPVAKVTGWGPEPALLELAEWAAWRWWGRPRSLLATASPLTAVTYLPVRPAAGPASPARPAAGAEAELVRAAWAPGVQLLRLPPDYRATEVVLAALELAAGTGPVLVVAPTTGRAEAGYAALRRQGVSVALLPGEWAMARAGAADVVIGARGAAWGPCPGMSAIVVLDAHDEALTQEQAPTWDAPTVLAERARRAGVTCLLVSPCPTLELEALAGRVHRVSVAAERHGWAPLQVVDTRTTDPRTGLYSPVVVGLARAEERVAYVLNRKGRAQLLACVACGDIATCERCGAAMQLLEEGLQCRRCRDGRPVVCLACGSDALKLLRVGVARAREQLEALAGRPVGEVTELTGELPGTPVLVGTESLLYREGELHRAGGLGAVAFLDFDQELLAPRYRAAEEALALLARASRLVGGRAGGRVVVQTRSPGHPVLQAAQRADPGLLTERERPVRAALQLPPFAALAVLSGPGAAELAEQLGTGVGRAPGLLSATEAGGGRWLVKARDHAALAEIFAGLRRPEGKVRVEIGPVRQ